MLLLIDKKFTEVHPLLNSAGHHVENWQGSPHQKEYLKVYFLVLQVCHYLMAGQVSKKQFTVFYKVSLNTFKHSFCFPLIG